MDFLTPSERTALLLSTLAGASTTLGAAAAVLKRPGPPALAFLLGLAAGVMGLLAVVELWWANAREHGWAGVTTSVAAGAALYAWAAPRLPSLEGEGGPLARLFGVRAAADATAARAGPPPAAPAGQPPPSPSELLRLGLVLAVTMTLHNLPEGVAVAAAAGTGAGGHVAAAVAAHNIPEGIVVAAPVYAATGSRAAALAIAAASGLSEPVGAAGALLAARAWDWIGGGGGPSSAATGGGGLLPFLLAGAGGVMAAVCVLDLLPEAARCGARGRMVAGVGVGAGVMAATLAAGV